MHTSPLQYLGLCCRQTQGTQIRQFHCRQKTLKFLRVNYTQWQSWEEACHFPSLGKKWLVSPQLIPLQLGFLRNSGSTPRCPRSWRCSTDWGIFQWTSTRLEATCLSEAQAYTFHVLGTVMMASLHSESGWTGDSHQPALWVTSSCVSIHLIRGQRTKEKQNVF